MFTLRLAIVLFIIALFFPSTPEEKQQVYRSVSSAVEDVQTFCVRNASLCDNVGYIASAVADRVYIGAQIVYEAAIGEPEVERQGDRERSYPARSEDRPSRREQYDRRGSEHSTNTLRRDDLSPEWRGPGAG